MADKNFTISQLTADARSILREIEQAHQQAKLQTLLEEARADPTVHYRNKKWYPRFVVWELTLACNMRCKHCGSAAGKPRPDELTRDELLKLCDDLGELECERVTLLGGEPLIHPHWEDIARRLNSNGIRSNVITNGWTLHREDVVHQLKDAGLTIVGISVDGLEKSHDTLRNRPGSFQRIATGMDHCNSLGIPLGVATVVTTDSMNDLEEMYQFLLTKKVKVWQLQIGNPLGRLDRDNPILINPRRLPELLDFIQAKQALSDPIRIDVADNVGYYGHWEDEGIRQKAQGQPFYWTGCHAGIQAMGIDSNGDIKGCQSLPSTPEYIEGNIRHRSLKEIWFDPTKFSFKRRFQTADLAGYCAQCTYGPLCKAGCTSSALGYSNNIGDNPMCVHRAVHAEKGW